jgi:hypothetical protein
MADHIIHRGIFCPLLSRRQTRAMLPDLTTFQKLSNLIARFDNFSKVVKSNSFIDKEFIRKYEALKESLKGDLFLLMEVEIEGGFQEIAIQIEHQSRREEVAERLFEYLCYVWLLKKQPVWSMVIYTDEADWRSKVPDKFWYGFSLEHQKQFFHFDVIKVKDEKSGDLIKKHSLLCKLLALKANDEGTDPEKLIYEIYQAAAKMKAQLTAEQLLLVNQWVDFYKKIPAQTLA